MNVHPVINAPGGRSVETAYAWTKRVAAMSVPVSILLVIVLALHPNKQAVFDSSMVLFVTNTLFISIASFLVALIIMRAYLQSGILRLLIVGSGALLFGLNSLVSGFLFDLPDGPNTAITAYNIAALVAGLFHLSVAWLFSAHVVLADSKHRLTRGPLAYLSVIVFTAVVILLSHADFLPPFFVQGSGSTPVRQLVLGGAILSFALASTLLYLFYLRSRAEFHYWYALSLALTAVGLGSVSFQSASGSWLNWTGRFTQQLGGLYLGVAVLTLLRERQLKGIALEMQVARFFRDAEANYQALVETVPDALVGVDEEGRIILWNSAAERTFGFSSSEAVGASFADLVFPETSPLEPRGDSEGLLHKGPMAPSVKITESIVTRKNGERFPIEFTVSARPTLGGSIGTLVLRDITDRKRAEEALKAAHQLTSEILESIQDGFFSLDRDWRFTYINARAAKNVGFTPDELIGQSLWEKFPQIRGTPHDTAYRKAMTERVSVRLEMEGVLTPSTYDIRVYPSAEGISAFWIDITERKRAEESLRKAMDHIRLLNRDLERRAGQLEMANKELDSFSYSVSHDLRAPLATIDGFARVLQDEYGTSLPEHAQRYVGLIRGGTRQMEQLIASLLSFSRLTSQPLKKKRVEVTELVREVLNELHEQAQTDHVMIDLKDLPEAEADPVLLKQVWVNLIANAVKFTRQCGNPRIEIGCTSCDGIKPVYYVQDNGVGFDMEQAERLFGVFQRLHSEEEFEGNGVGLAIVARIIHRHGGRVWAEGKPGKGATFYFMLG